MATARIGIVMHGVTGRMGMNQHLIRSIVAIRNDGGVRLSNGDRLMPDPILVGRDGDKLAASAKAHGIARTSTDLDAALARAAGSTCRRSRLDHGRSLRRLQPMWARRYWRRVWVS